MLPAMWSKPKWRKAASRRLRSWSISPAQSPAGRKTVLLCAPTKGMRHHEHADVNRHQSDGDNGATLPLILGRGLDGYELHL